jgi:hypothetical protein
VPESAQHDCRKPPSLAKTLPGSATDEFAGRYQRDAQINRRNKSRLPP